MIDLSAVPLAELKAEVEKREIIEKEARKKQRAEKVCCRNCAYRIAGGTNYGKLQGYESWVCYKKPKRFNTYTGSGPAYTQAYYACRTAYDGCKMFVHKDSKKGIRIRKKLSPMSGRV